VPDQAIWNAAVLPSASLSSASPLPKIHKKPQRRHQEMEMRAAFEEKAVKETVCAIRENQKPTCGDLCSN